MGENAKNTDDGWREPANVEEARATEEQSLYEESLAARVEAVFSGIPYPGDNRLMLDLYQGHWEADIAAEAFAGRHWKTVPLKTLGFHLESLHYFTPEAFRYYLPAYLLAALRRLSDAEASTRIVDIPWTLDYHLTPPKQRPALDEFRARMSGLTLEQKMIVRDYLRWAEQCAKEWEQECLPERARGGREQDDKEIALKEYWENIK